MFGAQIAAKAMVQRGRGGVIVNMLSSCVYRVGGNPAHYRASKAGLLAITQSLAVELGRHNVRVIGVAPTLINTPRVEQLREDGFATGLDAFVRRLPLRRIGTADEVATAALFAVSDMASFMTGCVLDVDGGETAK